MMSKIQSQGFFLPTTPQIVGAPLGRTPRVVSQPLHVACAKDPRREGPAPAAPSTVVRGPRVSELTPQRVALYRLLSMGATAVAGAALITQSGLPLVSGSSAMLGIGIGVHAAYHLAFSRNESAAQAVRNDKSFHLHESLPFVSHHYDGDHATWILPADLLLSSLMMRSMDPEAVSVFGLMTFGFLATAFLKSQLLKRPTREEAIKNAWTCHKLGDMDGLCDWIDELVATGNSYAYEKAGRMLMKMDRLPWAAAMFRVAFFETFDHADAFVRYQGEYSLQSRLSELEALYFECLGQTPGAQSAGSKPSTATPSRSWPEVLGVSPSATLEQVKAAFRALAKQRHPDKQGTHEGMIELQQAYERAKASFK